MFKKSLLTNKFEIDYISESLRKMINSNEFFSLPVSLEKSHFDNIRKYPYAITEKNNGERFILFFLSKTLYAISRSLNFYKLYEDKNERKSFAFDCEFIYSSNEFIVLDCLLVNGIYVGNSFLFGMNGRLKLAMDFLSSLNFSMPYYEDDKKKLHMIKTTVKNFYHFNDIEKFMEKYKMNANNNKIDGIILIPINYPIIYGRNVKLYKWKKDHTIDFLCKYGKYDTVELYVQNVHQSVNNAQNANQNLNVTNDLIKIQEIDDFKKFKHIFNTDIKFKNIFDKIEYEKNGYKKIVECFYEYESKLWIPKMERTDKTIPNNIKTYERTLISVNENISLSNIVELKV